MLPRTALHAMHALALDALPLVEIELPWNPPSLTSIPPMQLFLGLIGFTFICLVALYFYNRNTKQSG